MSTVEIVYLCLAIWFGFGIWVLVALAKDKKINSNNFDDVVDCIFVLVLALPVGAYTLIKNLIDKLRKKRKPKD